MDLPNISPYTVELDFEDHTNNPGKVWFGKYKGLTIEELIKKDTQYCIWCKRNIKGFTLTEEQEKLLEEEIENPSWDDINLDIDNAFD